jgi:CheY-like chemotaxis protein
MNSLLSRSNDKVKVTTSPHADSGAKPLVLVVEDHEDTRFMLEYLLEIHGCHVLVVENGVDAVEVAETRHPDLILMDTALPRLDGLQATRRIRELAALNDVPIVFLSGHAQPNFRAEALATGGNDFITKPFGIDQLEGVLERHLGKSAGAGPL